MATAEKLPSLSILTLPPCLLKVSQGSFSPLSDILLHHIPPFHWRQSSNMPHLDLTHIHPPGHFILFHSFHVAKPLQRPSFHFFHRSTHPSSLHPHDTFLNAHTHFFFFFFFFFIRSSPCAPVGIICPFAVFQGRPVLIFVALTRSTTRV